MLCSLLMKIFKYLLIILSKDYRKFFSSIIQAYSQRELRVSGSTNAIIKRDSNWITFKFCAASTYTAIGCATGTWSGRGTIKTILIKTTSAAVHIDGECLPGIVDYQLCKVLTILSII